jgi:hypothetical protein
MSLLKKIGKKIQEVGKSPAANIVTGGVSGTAAELAKGKKANLGRAATNYSTKGLSGTNASNGIAGAVPGVSTMMGTEVKLDQAVIDAYADSASQFDPLAAQYQQMYDNTRVVSNVDPAFRNYQLGLAQQLQAQATGQGPSLAQLQLQQATDRGLQQSLGAIRSATGANAGLAARTASLAGAQQLGQMGAQSGILRLQEQQQAQNALAGLAGQGRQGDIATDQSAIQAADVTLRSRLGALGGLSNTVNDKAGIQRDIFQAKTGADLATAENKNRRTEIIGGGIINGLIAGGKAAVKLMCDKEAKCQMIKM